MSEMDDVPDSAEHERAESPAIEGAETVTRWLKELGKADEYERKWRERAEKVVKRYRDERNVVEQDDRSSQFNILYANIQVLKGQMYQRTPVPDVRRRFADKDPVARQAALILQRALSFSVDSYDFDGVITDVVEDALLPGRGVPRVAYKPTMGMVDGVEQVVYEEVCCEYVEWKWFRMSPATRWSKVRWIAFGELLTRQELVKQFGDVGNTCTLDWHPKDKETEPDYARALVWMVWDKTSRKLYAVCKGCPDKPLRVTDDPLNLEGFWPIPKPLYAATETTNSMIPIPEYVQYQDLAIELDVVTERISKLIDALRRRGIYDASQPELAKLAEAGDDQFIPAENFAALLEKGGVTNLFMELPIEGIAKVVLSLYTQRDQIKATIYEVTGISDIVRGATKSDETLGAQQLKARYSNTRIGNGQKKVAKLARDLLRLKGEIIAERFSPETLKLMTGPDLWLIDQQMPGPDGQPTTQKVDVTEQIMSLLRNDRTRGFRIDIETDSTIEPDASEEQKNRIEFLTAVTGYIEQVGPLVASQAIPLEVAKEFLSFGARAFKVSPQLEDAIDKLGDKDGNKMQPQQPLQPVDHTLEIEQAKTQREGQTHAADLQREQQQKVADLQREEMMARHKEQLDAQQKQYDAAAHNLELDAKERFDKWKAELDAATRIMVAQISAKASLDQAAQAAEQGAAKELEANSKGEQQNANINDLHGKTLEALRSMMETMNRPKEIVRGPDGRAVGLRVV